ncbi:MAG: hypothetical protein HQL03_09325 [Nitrospirae bacterium]|nr:hypothetical protein [Nitrospirota bacterium]
MNKDKGQKKVSPYSFVKRPKYNKSKPAECHDRLSSGRYDVAFDITWTTLTPTAVNPCVNDGVDECCPMPEDSQTREFAGYNKRWLMLDNCLAISPFTVKSAIANGFANLLGGCYRVVKKKVAHKEKLGEGQYPYTGAYKRYRVAMGKAKSGIIKAITKGDKDTDSVEG